MSNEFETEIKESVLNERITNFVRKFKKKIIVSFFLILVLILSYYTNFYLKQKEYASQLNDYSVAIKNLNSKTDEAKKIFKNLLKSNNDTIVMLALNQLVNLNSKNDIITEIDIILKKNTLSKKNIDLLKFKKALILFDDIDENSINTLLGDNSDSFLKQAKLEILKNFNESKKIKN